MIHSIHSGTPVATGKICSVSHRACFSLRGLVGKFKTNYQYLPNSNLYKLNRYQPRGNCLYVLAHHYKVFKHEVTKIIVIIFIVIFIIIIHHHHYNHLVLSCLAWSLRLLTAVLPIWFPSNKISVEFYTLNVHSFHGASYACSCLPCSFLHHTHHI